MAMPTSRESICCCEVDEVIAKKEEINNEISCIIDHKGFESVFECMGAINKLLQLQATIILW